MRLAAAVCVLVFAPSALAASPDVVSARTSQVGPGQRVLTLGFSQGFRLNERVPRARRLVLEAGERTWRTEDFEVRPGGARLRLEGAVPEVGRLTAYVCRRDLCRKLTVAVRL